LANHKNTAGIIRKRGRQAIISEFLKPMTGSSLTFESDVFSLDIIATNPVSKRTARVFHEEIEDGLWEEIAEKLRKLVMNG